MLDNHGGQHLTLAIEIEIYENQKRKIKEILKLLYIGLIY